MGSFTILLFLLEFECSAVDAYLSYFIRWFGFVRVECRDPVFRVLFQGWFRG